MKPWKKNHFLNVTLTHLSVKKGERKSIFIKIRKEEEGRLKTEEFGQGEKKGGSRSQKGKFKEKNLLHEGALGKKGII